MPALTPASAGGPRIISSSEVGRAWSGHPVAFSLVTRGECQSVSFYDEQRRMCIARRVRRGHDWEPWATTRVQGVSPVFGADATPTTTGWDWHNYIALGFDRVGHPHLSGNLHGNPLLYFRTTSPGGPTTLVRLDRMTGDRERQVTYPRFFTAPGGEMVFGYRDGWSGSGADLYNLYDEASGT